MASLNKCFLLGNLCADVDLAFTPKGVAVANFRMATNEVWTDKQSGERQEKSEFHRVRVWGKAAENAAEYLAKGSQVHVEGHLETRTWEGKDGKKNYTTEIVAERVTYLTAKNGDPR